MSANESRSKDDADVARAPQTAKVPLKLEVVIIPVSDVDRSKAFYAKLGWRLDADFAFDNGFRVVQFTPPGSACSVQFGSKITSASPGSTQSLYLIVSDIEAAREELAGLGVDVSDVFHPAAPGAQFQSNGASGRLSGSAPNHATYSSFATFRDPDGNSWLLQEITNRLPGRIDPGVTSFGSTTELARAMRRASVAHGEHEKRIGGADPNWPDWYSAYMAAEQAGTGAAEVSDYDVIVIGGGSPGEYCAGALAQSGLRVALVERELVGGECSYWACIPSKTLLRPGEAVNAAREAGATAEVNVSAALAWRDFMVSNYSDAGQERWLAEHGIDLLRGHGRLVGIGAVEVDGVQHTADYVVLANGADAVIPPIPGLRELEGIWTSREVTSMKAVPKSLLILGGGPVGAEMAQAVHRLGGGVTIIEHAAQLLPREAAPLGQALGDALRHDGIDVALQVRAVKASCEGNDYILQPDDERELRGDRLLVATGRRPRVKDIGLEKVGVTAVEHGVPVDAHTRVRDRLWAVGDITGIWQLTHVGKYQAEVAASNILGEPREANYDAVPRVIFTDPEAAVVGVTDARFKATGALKDVAKTATYTRSYAESNGFLTLSSDGERLTGAYALGPEAGEWLQQATLGVRARVPLAVFRDTIQPFPTFSEIFVQALHDLHVASRSPTAAGHGTATAAVWEDRTWRIPS